MIKDEGFSENTFIPQKISRQFPFLEMTKVFIVLINTKHS